MPQEGPRPALYSVFVKSSCLIVLVLFVLRHVLVVVHVLLQRPSQSNVAGIRCRTAPTCTEHPKTANMRARCKTPETSRLPSYIQRPAQAQVLEVHGATSVPSQVLRKVLETLLETRGTPPLQLGLSGYRCRSSAARVAHLETANIK